jgi:hypothetical protein
MHRDHIGAGFLAPYLPSFDTSRALSQRWHFASMADLETAAPIDRPATAWTTTAWEPGFQVWQGATIRDAHRMASQGWQEGAERCRAIARSITLAQPQKPRVARWDVAGSVASIPRHLAGNPMAMRRTMTDPTKRQPVITLLAPIGASSTVDAREFERAAAVAAAMVDRLETAGFRVEVISVNRIGGILDLEAQSQAEVAVMVKRAEDSLNLETLAFALGHPAMSRRLTHAVMQTGLKISPKASIGFTLPLDQLPGRPAGSYALPVPGSYPSDDARAFRVACRRLAAQGCPGIPEDLAA